MAKDRVRRARQAKGKTDGGKGKGKGKGGNSRARQAFEGQRLDCGTGQSFEVRGEFELGEFLGPRHGGGSGLQWLAQASSNVCGRSRSGRAFGPTQTRGIVCVCAQHPWSGMCQGSTAAWRALFFLMQKEPATMPGSETFSPFFAADIRTPFFSLLMSSRSAHRHAVTWKGIVSRWQKARARVARATVPAVLMEPRQAVKTTLRLVIWSMHVWKPI